MNTIADDMAVKIEPMKPVNDATWTCQQCGNSSSWAGAFLKASRGAAKFTVCTRCYGLLGDGICPMIKPIKITVEEFGDGQEYRE